MFPDLHDAFLKNYFLFRKGKFKIEIQDQLNKNVFNCHQAAGQEGQEREEAAEEELVDVEHREERKREQQGQSFHV